MVSFKGPDRTIYIILSYVALAVPFFIFPPNLSFGKYATPQLFILDGRQGPECSQRLPAFAAYSLFPHWSYPVRGWPHSEERHIRADTTSVSPAAAKLLVSLAISTTDSNLIFAKHHRSFAKDNHGRERRDP